MRPLHYTVRKTGKAAKADARYTGKILVSFPSGTAGKAESTKRFLVPKIISDTEVRVTYMHGLWRVNCECFQFQEMPERFDDKKVTPLKDRYGKTYRARFSWSAGELIKWLK